MERPNARKSVVWLHMKRLSTSTVLCKICMSKFAYCKNSTTNMLRHLKRFHPEQYRNSVTVQPLELKDNIDIIWQFMYRICQRTFVCKLCRKTLSGKHITLLRHLVTFHPEVIQSDDEDTVTSKNISNFENRGDSQDLDSRHNGDEGDSRDVDNRHNGDEGDSQNVDRGHNENDDDYVPPSRMNSSKKSQPKMEEEEIQAKNLCDGGGHGMDKLDEEQRMIFKKQTSIIWQCMERDSKGGFICKFCKKRFINYSTAVFWRHLRSRHPGEVKKSGGVWVSASPSNFENVPSSSACSEESLLTDTAAMDMCEGDDARSLHVISKPSTVPSSLNPTETGRIKSVVWLYMERTNATHVQCKLCMVSQSYTGSTGAMLKHLKRRHSKVLRSKHPELFVLKPSEAFETCDDEDERSLLAVSKSSTVPCSVSSLESSLPKSASETACHESNAFASLTPRTTSSLNHLKSSAGKGSKNLINCRFLINMIVCDLQPCSIVESAGFKIFAKALNPRFMVPSQMKIEKEILKLHKEHQSLLQEQIEKAPGISLSIEIWTYKEGQQYMTVTGHFVSKTWEPQSVILKTVFLDNPSEPGANIAEKLTQILCDWNIENKVTCIVTDNSEPLTAAVTLLNKPHFQCIARALNHVVLESLKSSKGIGYLVEKVKAIARLSINSPDTCDPLTSPSKILSRLSLHTDSEWISTYKMFKQYQNLHSYIPDSDGVKKEADLHAPHLLTPEELELLNSCVQVLEPFVLAAEEISSENFTMLSKSLPVFEMLQQMMSSQMKSSFQSPLVEYDTVTLLAGQLSEQLEHCMRNIVRNREKLLSFTATFLDPRFKPVVLMDEDILSSVKDELQQQMETSEMEESEHQKSRTSTFVAETSCLWSSYDKTVKRSANEKKMKELNRFIEEGPVSRHENPYLYWKDREPLYPKLCNIVKKILSIPATSVPSNQVFSVQERKKLSRRTFLEEKNIDSILFLSTCQIVTDK